MKTSLFDQVDKGLIDFAGLEKIIWKSSLTLFQHLIVKILEEIDKFLMATRDKERYELKEKKERTLQTLVGPITIQRRYYWDKEEASWVYLLDQALKLEQYEAISPGLMQLAVTWAVKGPSYRDARDRLADLYGAQVLSHEAIRQAVLEVGEATAREDENKIIREEGKRQVKALFIEVDGFGARIQKPKRGEKRRREVKLAVIHEGWERRQGRDKKQDYRLVNPIYIPIVKENKDFWEYTRGRLKAIYKDLDSIPVVINGDGTAWIREGADSFGKGIYQYDRFHVARTLREALKNRPKELKEARKALKNNDMGKLLCEVTDAWKKADEREKEKLEALKDMLLENHKYIRDYRIRLKEAGEEISDDWRSMGAAESNVDKFKNRTAKRGRAWSQKGLQAIVTMLSKLYEGDISKCIPRHLEEKEEWILDKIKDGGGSIIKKIKTESQGVIHGGFPATDRGTQGFATLFRSILRAENF
ncbi:MAG: ISLre2 family transposase [Deltaproteobacteria bacterium]|nr:ISLre2 family transposase [Deltaproteobacteria bacterium]